MAVAAGRGGAHRRQVGVGEDVSGGPLQRRLGPHSPAHLAGHADAGQPLPHAPGLPGPRRERVA